MTTGAQLQKPRLGWIGLGNMGQPITKNLLLAGNDLAVYDVDAGRMAALVALGARSMASAEALMRACDIVFTMLPNDAAVQSVIAHAAAQGALTGRHTVVDLSTISPTCSMSVATALQGCGAAYLRAPVSGSTASAADGTLAIFCSGPREAFDACLPFLRTIGNKQSYAGCHEEARYLKLLVNMVVGATPSLLGEALGWGQRAGLPWELMIETLAKSAAASPVLLYKTDMLKSKDWKAMATLDIAAKDLALALSVGSELHATMPFTALAQRVNRKFQAAGRGSQDYFSTASWASDEPANEVTTTHEVLELERQRADAMVRADTQVLEQLLDEHLVYSHSNGETDSKGEYLGRLQDGLQYLNVRHTEQRVKDLGETAVVHSRMAADLVLADGRPVALDSRATAVWHRAQQDWKLVSFQASPLLQ